jgi:hypothetical protein
MSKYPLEWGWHHQPDDEETSVTSSPRETLLGHQPKEDDVHDAAWGDRRCANHPKKSGQTGAYEVEGRILCRDCAVKCLGIGDEPSNEQYKVLIPYELKPR